MRDRIKTLIAIFLFKIGVPHRTTMFIDEVTLMYGYGKCLGYGAFEYELPAKYVKRKQ